MTPPRGSRVNSDMIGSCSILDSDQDDMFIRGDGPSEPITFNNAIEFNDGVVLSKTDSGKLGFLWCLHLQRGEFLSNPIFHFLGVNIEDKDNEANKNNLGPNDYREFKEVMDMYVQEIARRWNTRAQIKNTYVFPRNTI